MKEPGFPGYMDGHSEGVKGGKLLSPRGDFAKYEEQDSQRFFKRKIKNAGPTDPNKQLHRVGKPRLAGGQGDTTGGVVGDRHDKGTYHGIRAGSKGR